MNVYYVTFRSVTLAQRGEVLLRKNGLRSQLQRTPRWMEEQGCGYCLRIQTGQIGMVREILNRGRIPYRKIYELKNDGMVEEVQHDLPG